MSIVLTDENFQKEVLEAKKPVFVDFWMHGCGPCDLFVPILERLSDNFSEKIIFAKANIDENVLIARQYGINAAPTIILFKEGKPVSGFVGLRAESEVKNWLESFLVGSEEKDEEVLIKEYEDYAKKNGFFLNPDKRITEGVVKSLLEREKKFGQKYCPCRKISGDKEEDKKIICPCVYHLEEIKKDGHCLCRLFVKNI